MASATIQECFPLNVFSKIFSSVKTIAFLELSKECTMLAPLYNACKLNPPE